MKFTLESFLEEVNERTIMNDQYPVLTSSKSGLFLQSDYFNKQVASKDNTGYKIIHRGEFTYRAMSDTGEFFPNMLECAGIGIVSPAYPVFKISNPDIIVPQYLKYFFKSDAFQRSIASFAQGSTRTSVKFSKMKTVSIDLPSIADQIATIYILDKVSHLISLRKQQLETLDEMVKARFVEMFGDPVSNSKNLPELTLLELGVFGRGVSKHRPRNDPKLLGGKYPLIQTGEVANSELYITSYENTYSELGLKQSKIWQAGTLCITIAANIAKTAILTFDACFPDSVVGFKANDKTNNIFIHYWFSFFQAILEAQAPESAQKNINLKILSELKIIVPPIDLQNQFATFVEQIDKSKLAIQNSLTQLETLKKALMQEYFG